jgi:hypothetical protein
LTHRIYSSAALVLLGSIFLVGGSLSQELRYFPERGQTAIHQRTLELSSGAVVLIVALQPGYEDLPLLAHLRMELGARAVVAYVTNGEATPGDIGFTAPAYTAAQRKEEAYAATRMLGTTAHFLNLPDPGVVRLQETLLQIWNSDTAHVRFDRTLRQYRPDVVVVCGDFRSDTIASVRQRLLTDVLLGAIQTAGRDTVRSDTVKVTGWKVPRVYVESARDARNVERIYDKRHPLWKTSYRSIAAEAAREYKTLWLQIGSWIRQGDRRYTHVYPQGTVAPRGMLDGLPEISPGLRSLGGKVRDAAGRQVRGMRTPRLSEVSRAIDSVDLFLGRNRRSIPSGDLRLLAGWKNGLEELRCSLLNVKVDFSASESLLAPDQIFFLKVNGVSSRGTGKRDWILFPGAIDHTWGINTSIEHQFSLNPPQEFQVLTPHEMEMTVPVSQFGLTQSAMRTRFSFIVMHQDSVRERSFFYRGEVLLRIGPRRTFEVLTPIVRGIEGEGVSYRLLNISRDAYQGSITIVDSLAKSISKEVFLPTKDFVLVDTVHLSLQDTLPDGLYPMNLELSGGGSVQKFLVRSFEARVDSQARIGLLTCVGDSPVAQAMRRLRLPWKSVDTSFASRSDLSAFNVILVDRDAFQGIRGITQRAGAIREWVRGGGRLVVLPQAAASDGGAAVLPGAAFGSSSQLSPVIPVIFDTTRALSRIPNRLTEADWEGWVGARSMNSIHIDSGVVAHIFVASSGEGFPLVATIPVEKGEIMLVALDLNSQFLNVHPGAHRLLANLLATQRENKP